MKTMNRACPICDEPCPPPAENRFFPFCSVRCQLIDLGRWLDGDYRIPGESVDPEVDEQEEYEGYS